MSASDEKSDSGSPIYRHQAPTDQPSLAETDTLAVEALERHIEQYIGAHATVLHELVSEYVHVDIYMVPPSGQNNFYTLVTMGMSDLPMDVPAGAEHLRYAEVMVCLPESWKMSQQDWQEDEANYWPIRWLKILARLPHQYRTWLTSAHTIPNGDPPKSFASNTEFCGVILAPPLLFPVEYAQIAVKPDKNIRIYGMIPLYKEEMDFKLTYGAQALFERLDEANVSELLELGRKNTCLS